VLEFGHVVSGPYCAMMLADLGADVIKVEAPDRPDMLRSSGAREPGSGRSLAFETVNRGKTAISLDLGTAEGRRVLDKMLLTSDVLIENYRPGVAERLGIGYGHTSKINPRIVQASISGFGRTGPLRELGGYDMIAQAMSGLMSVTGPAGQPTKVGVPISDIASALYATIGILAALRARDGCGHGQHVDCSLFDSALSFGVWESAEYFATGEAPQASGNAHRALAPYQPLRASDGWFVIAANTDEHFVRLAAALQMPDLLTDVRFGDNAARVEHRIELAGYLEAVTRLRPRTHWCELLRAAGVPSGEILDFRAALEHPQAVARGMVAEVAAEDIGGARRVLGNPVKLSHTPVGLSRGAPSQGQHLLLPLDQAAGLH
jgi:crotonobetainyl-CoA:carnitine CoA-transferase CaiB-like acyl-CoA transferase